MAKLKLTKQKIIEAIPKTHGVKKYLAEKLGVDRMTLYRYLKKYPSLESEIQEHLEAITDIAEFNRGYSTRSESTFNSTYPMQVITTGVADP